MTDTDTLRQRAQAFLAAAEKATPAPWIEGNGDSTPAIYQTRHITRDIWSIPHNEDDLPYIVAARNDAPALVAELLARVEQLEQALQRAVDVMPAPMEPEAKGVSPGYHCSHCHHRGRAANPYDIQHLNTCYYAGYRQAKKTLEALPHD